MKYQQFVIGGVFLVFLFLKLAEVGQVASWSWWWVTCPLWVLPAIALVVATVLLFVVIVCKAVSGLLRMFAK